MTRLSWICEVRGAVSDSQTALAKVSSRAAHQPCRRTRRTSDRVAPGEVQEKHEPTLGDLEREGRITTFMALVYGRILGGNWRQRRATDAEHAATDEVRDRLEELPRRS